MKLRTFCVPYIFDERMNYASEYLKNRGYELVDCADDADFVLLPIPVKDYMFENLEGKVIFFGAGDYRGFDYNKLDSFLIENAYLTAEGAVALLKENTSKAIYNSKILITGYGRIASALHRELSAMGAKVTVCCRSDKDKTAAGFMGAKVIGFDELKKENSYDVIFNTVPHMVFTKAELDAVGDDALLIDLASFPGGVDTLYAKSKGIRLIDGKKLPSRYSKQSAGELIGRAVEKIIKEDFS
ncbi:MAG: NAD(P)-dependent oxidoreductase [Eubacterium sp.]